MDMGVGAGVDMGVGAGVGAGIGVAAAAGASEMTLGGFEVGTDAPERIIAAPIAARNSAAVEDIFL